MFKNPYSPVFGGKPDLFFGRERLLARFDAALLNAGSDDRALFVTGTRGSGKTALLERLSQRAAERGWHTIDLGPEHTAEMMVRQLVRHHASTTTISPQASVSVMGVGGSVGGISTSKTTTYDVVDLPVVLLEACQRHRRGIFVSIDEVQKVALDEMSSICNAFQMASRKGLNLILAIAGLPYAYDRIIHEEGCTYMRRGSHEELSLLTVEESTDAFATSLGDISGIAAPDDLLGALVRGSMGHPYMIQLIGYYLISMLNDEGVQSPHAVSAEEAAQAVRMALSTYEARALAPLVSELSETERAYLRAMVDVMDERHIAKTVRVAARLNRKPASLTRARDTLLRDGIIIAPERGSVRFAIPYLRDYLTQGSQQNSVACLVESWDV